MLRNLKSDPEICTDELNDRLVIITGATSGIGFAAAKKYASHGAEILSINRNEQKSIEFCEAIKNQYGSKCAYWIADLSRLSEVHAVAEKLAALETNIDVLIHNAGMFNTKKTITADNMEAVFQTNYLSTFILNYYLKEKFIKQNSGRILFVNSEAHRFAAWGLHLDDLAWEKHAYSGLKSYGAAKLAQLLSMIKLNEYFTGTRVTINAMHPGNVKTNSGQNNGPIYKFFKKIIVNRGLPLRCQRTSPIYYLGVSKNLENISGKFFNLTTEEEPAPPALDKNAAEELWALSLLLGEVK